MLVITLSMASTCITQPNYAVTHVAAYLNGTEELDKLQECVNLALWLRPVMLHGNIPIALHQARLFGLALSVKGGCTSDKLSFAGCAWHTPLPDGYSVCIHAVCSLLTFRHGT